MPEDRRGEWRQALRALAKTQKPDTNVDYGASYAGPEPIDPVYSASRGASLRNAPPPTWRDTVRGGWQAALQAIGALPDGGHLTYDQRRLVNGLVGPPGRQQGAVDALLTFAAPQATLPRAIAVAGAPSMADAASEVYRGNNVRAFGEAMTGVADGILNRLGAKDPSRMRAAGNDRARKDQEWKWDFRPEGGIDAKPGKGYRLAVNDDRLNPRSEGVINAGGNNRAILNKQGNKVGEIRYTVDAKGDGTNHIDVDWVGRGSLGFGGGMHGANTLGPSAVRQIARQLRNEHGATSIGGYRISGARRGKAESVPSKINGFLSGDKSYNANTVLKGAAPVGALSISDWIEAVKERDERKSK